MRNYLTSCLEQGVELSLRSQPTGVLFAEFTLRPSPTLKYFYSFSVLVFRAEMLPGWVLGG